jgi:ribosome-associated translation inhibitor RaiA
MRIDVRFRSLDPSTVLRDHVVRRIHFHLSRFGHAVASISLRISDVNGPKGGPDKQCRVTVRGGGLPEVTIEELSADAYTAVDLAVERAGRAVGRELERMRAKRTSSPLPRRAS